MVLFLVLAYFYIVWMVWKGDVAKLANSAGGAVAKANKSLAYFVVIGWGYLPYPVTF